MKQYIKQNLTPLLIGLNIGMITMATATIIEDIIVKIALIKSK